MHRSQFLYRSCLLVLLLSCLCSCNDGVITFPTPSPAGVRIINTTQNVENCRVTIDSTTIVDVLRGGSSSYVAAPAGRPISFTIGSPTNTYRSNIRYTLGGDARIILFARGDTNSTIEFRREIQDTVIADPNGTSVMSFTHMAERVNTGYFVEVWITGGNQLFGQDFEPGISSTKYEPLPPGTYSFEIRESGTTNVLATLTDVVIGTGTSYMLYTYDKNPPTEDQIRLAIAN